MNQKVVLTIVFLVVVLLQNCTKAVFEDVPVSDLPPLTRVVIYNPEVANIISDNCSECHAGSSPSANLDLTTYQSVVQEMENGEMWERLNNSISPMPPTGKLSPATLQIIEKWSKDGYPEN